MATQGGRHRPVAAARRRGPNRTARRATVVDLSTAGRWPRFTAAAPEAGFVAVHALPMRLRSEVIGALGLFDTRPGALDEGKVRIAQPVRLTARSG